MQDMGAVTIEDILYEYRWHDGALTSTMRKDNFNCVLEKNSLKEPGILWKIRY